MPTPKFFKSSSKSNVSESGSVADVPANDKEGIPNSTNVTPGDAVPAYSDSFKEVWAAAHRDVPKAQGAEKVLNKIVDAQNALPCSSEQQTVLKTLATPAKALMDSSQIAGAVHKGVDAFMDAVPPLMKALDEVAKIHPFIQVVVIAFKAVYTLEKKRHENDKRVLTLYAEMKDMVQVLLQLQNVSDPKQAGPDGQTIKGRMERLCEAASEDIKKCANTCDTYLKKKLLVKIFAGPVWEPKLLAFVGVFTERRDKFKFALAIHTAVKLDSVYDQTEELSRKMDVMLELFKEFVTPQQKELAAKVEEMGGSAAQENEEMMEELDGIESTITRRPGGRSDGGRSKFTELQREIKGDPAEAIEDNSEFFNRKFDVQRRQIEEDMARMLNREGDRIIKAITGGPQDRIVDPDIYCIWKDMGWRGSVKARHFVMALKDHFVEKTAKGSGSPSVPDSWALQYINIGRARSILEAFDDDASGFVTVNEVNDFTQSRPLGWSMPYWIAYWAIGWEMACTKYCVKIREIIDAMIRLAPEVLPENQESVNYFINTTWNQVKVFVQSIKGGEGTEELWLKFKPYVAAEEARLQRNLEDLKYQIDGSDTVRVISGEGRIETTLFPMLYLVLKRYLEKISLARKYVLDGRDLGVESGSAIDQIIDAVSNRIESLKGIFEQQNLTVEDQFKIFAKGLYNLLNTYDEFSTDKSQGSPDPTPSVEIVVLGSDSIPLSVLDHPLGKRDQIDFAAYDPPVLSPTEGDHPVFGVFYGFIYEYKSPSDYMVGFTLTKGEGEHTFVATGVHHREAYYSEYEITGNWSPPSEDAKTPIELKITYKTAPWSDLELKGVFDPEENSLRGSAVMPWHDYKDGTWEFVFKRDPDLVRFYPAPSATSARARWGFATTLVLDRVRREAWSSQRIFQRIRDRKLFMKIALRPHGRAWADGEWEEVTTLKRRLYEADVQFFNSVMKVEPKTAVDFGRSCGNCSFSPSGSMVVCTDCRIGSTVYLCSETGCINSTVISEGQKPHLPNHRMFKVHRYIFDRELPKIATAANKALDIAHSTISQLKREGIPMGECAHCSAPLSLPYWWCGECKNVKVMCDDCEYNNLAFNEIHTKMHTIVRVSEGGGRERSTEERLQFLEDEMATMKRTLAEMRQTLGKLAEEGTEPLHSKSPTEGDLRAAATGAESVN